MMKKMLCLVLALLLCPFAALAEESGANMLDYQELRAWAEDYIARALVSEPLNDPSESQTADGYEYIYSFATMYADTPALAADTTFNAIVLTGEEESGLRGVNVGSDLSDVLSAYYCENERLLGSYESAVLYAADALPESAAWAQALRDGQRIQTVQYAVHEQLAAGGAGYTDAGVIYTMAENRVAALRVYGLNARASLEDVDAVMYAMMLGTLESDYAQVPFSYDGLSLTPFAQEDAVFAGLDFLTLTPDQAIAALGEPMSDTWMDDGEAGYIRVQTFGGCELTYQFNRERTEGQIYMLHILADGMEGPRAVRIGDSFSAVYNRFRNGEGEYQEDGSELLYGSKDAAAYGEALYGMDASASLRYVFTSGDGRRVVLYMDFSVMELTEILLFCE